MDPWSYSSAEEVTLPIRLWLVADCGPLLLRNDRMSGARTRLTLDKKSPTMTAPQSLARIAGFNIEASSSLESEQLSCPSGSEYSSLSEFVHSFVGLQRWSLRRPTLPPRRSVTTWFKVFPGTKALCTSAYASVIRHPNEVRNPCHFRHFTNMCPRFSASGDPQNGHTDKKRWSIRPLLARCFPVW